MARTILPVLPEPRHSDCLLYCKSVEATGRHCWYGCTHLERKPAKKRHPNDRNTPPNRVADK